MLRSTVVSMCLLGLAACAAAPGGPGASAAPAGSGASASLAGTRWVGAASGSDIRTAARLEFLAGGRVSGFTGCNMLSGTWREEGGEVRFGAIATTKRMCLGPEGETEKLLLAAIGNDSRARREGPRLVLTAPGGARFEFNPAS